MQSINIICVGKLKEKFYADAVSEYLKRLVPYAKVDIEELPEVKRSGDPSAAETENALLREADAISAKIPKGSTVCAMCVEGKRMSSEKFAELFDGTVPKLCFLIGGSDGLHSSLKAKADMRLSVSDMTFPHHLFRVMLLEQIYRGYKINEGGRYHK